MDGRKRKWTKARRAKHAATMAAKKESGLPKALPPTIVQYYRGQLRTLRLQMIQAYLPEDDT